MVVNFVTALHRVARLGEAPDVRDDPRLGALLRGLELRFPPRKPHELANIAWALARLRLWYQPLMPAIATQAIIQMAEFSG